MSKVPLYTGLVSHPTWDCIPRMIAVILHARGCTGYDPPPPAPTSSSLQLLSSLELSDTQVDEP